MKRCLPLVFLLLSFTGFAQEQPQSRSKVVSYGIQASPDPITFVQPDGTEITCYLRGDMVVNWLESPDGYPIIKDGDGYYRYAVKNATGILEPGNIAVGQNSKKGINKTAEFKSKNPAVKPFSPAEISSMHQTFRQNSGQGGVLKAFTPTGTKNILLILIDFPDQAHTLPATQIDSMYNVDDWKGKGSFKQYYYENSYGQLTLNTTVIDWSLAYQPHNFYGNVSDPTLSRVQDLIRFKCNELNPVIDFTQYDNDGDGFVDVVFVVHEGQGD